MTDNVDPAVLESALKNKTFTYDDLREMRAEAASYRVGKKDAETKLAEAQAKLDRAAGEIAAGNEKLTASEKAANDRLIHAELKAIAVKAGLVDVDGLKLLDLSGVSLDKDGNLVGGDALIEAAKKSKPYLFGGAGGTGSTEKPPAKKAGEPKNAKDMTADEYRAARADLTRVRR